MQKFVSIVLRVGVGFVFLWFGIDKFFHPDVWLGWIPSWVPFVGVNLIYIMGVIETLVGLGIVVGFFLSYAALLATLMMLGIVFSLPWSEISVRDVGILSAALALFLAEKDSFTIDSWWRG